MTYHQCAGNCLECELPGCWLDQTREDDFSMLTEADYRATEITAVMPPERGVKRKTHIKQIKGPLTERQEYQRRYYDKNWERIQKYKHEWYMANREQILADRAAKKKARAAGPA